MEQKIVFKGTNTSIKEGNEFSLAIRADNGKVFCLSSTLNKDFINFLISINKLEIKEVKEVKNDKLDNEISTKIDNLIETLKNLNKEILYFNKKIEDIDEQKDY